ncbi:MAG: hypothetical protein ACE5FQ_15875, partial [Thiogranum sp.]
MKDTAYRYPQGAEREAINAAFDKLVGEIKTRETDKGVALFSLSEDISRAWTIRPEDDMATVVWKMLAQSDELFRYPASTAKDMMEIAQGIAPKIQVEEIVDKQYKSTPAKYRKVRHWLFTMPDGTQGRATQYANGEIFLNAALLKSTVSRGSALYAVVADYAHNNNLVFIGDPAGLSEDALVRRTEAMLASALKWGTTRHLAPHEDQTTQGSRPLNWKAGDDDHNLRELILTSYANAAKEFPEIRDLRYDFKRNEFKNRRTGEGFADVSALAKNIAGRTGTSGQGATPGSTTLARGIVTHSLLRLPRSERSELLAQVGRQLQLGLSPPFKGISYAATESPASAGLSVSEARTRLLQSPLGKAIQKLLDAGKLQIVQSRADLPDTARALSREGMAGAYYRGHDVIYMVADAVTKGNLESTLLHEAFHGRGREIVGEKGWERLMKRLRNLDALARRQKGGKAKTFFEEAQKAIPESTPEADRAEELAAYTVQKYLEGKPESLPATIARWVRDFIAAIRVGLMRMGVPIKNLTEADLAAVAKAALKRFAEGPAVGEMRAQAAFSFAGIAGAKANEIMDAAAEWLEKGVNSKYFKRWFGNSKVVDENGEPLIVYHGTNMDIDEFRSDLGGKITQARSAKEMMWFASLPSVADWYGAQATRVNYYKKHPELMNKDMRRLITAAEGRPQLNTVELQKRVMPEAFFGASIYPVYLQIKNPLVADLTKPRARQSIAALAEKAKKKGHDGIIVKVRAHEREGIPERYEYGVFRPEQIKSAIGNRGTFDPSDPNIMYSEQPEYQGTAAFDKLVGEIKTRETDKG